MVTFISMKISALIYKVTVKFAKDMRHDECYVNKCKKKLWFIHELTAHYTSKTAKNYKKVITHQHIA